MTTVSGTITESTNITDWDITALNVPDGSLWYTRTSGATSYSITLPNNHPVFLVFAPRIDLVWAASTAVTLGQFVCSLDPVANPHIWKCTTGGTTGTTEPTWATSGTTSDGSVVWTYVNKLVQPLCEGPIIPV